jgi:hypothetical protein
MADGKTCHRTRMIFYNRNEDEKVHPSDQLSPQSREMADQTDIFIINVNL